MREFGPDGTPTPSAAQGRGRRRQGTNDYFGPQATAGPYTEGVLGEGEVSVHGEGVLTPGLGRPVPVSPQGPGDIVPAVEMEASERRGEEERVPEYERVGMGKEEKVPETTRDRFELP